MQMRPFDVLYVANAPQVDITKVVTFLNALAVTGVNAVEIASSSAIASPAGTITP